MAAESMLIYKIVSKGMRLIIKFGESLQRFVGYLPIFEFLAKIDARKKYKTRSAELKK